MTDSKLQRLNMVESQVRPSDVTDRRIIRAMLEVPREKFVPAALVPMAYMDEPLPVSNANGAAERYLLAPRTFAKLVQLAEIDADAAVLDIGCATGYSTAVLARLARRVIALECDRALAEEARRLLAELGADNTAVVEDRLIAGVPAEAPFDAILLNGAVETVAPPLLEQLKDGGRLAAIVADGPLCRAQVWRRVGKAFDARPAFDAGAALLPGFARPAGFVF
ncbi:MAG: protein-L-isoaspartate O-methyltransferase [Hyphomonadaceae bacterium]|jgi:protein-L-isoaspartate(D-aspartate) O-methyltransferase|nr:protein-L-isoaspartate O-methyltransferase [Hyphomonadaceae bacterium]